MKKAFSPWLILVLVAIVWRVIYAYWTPVFLSYPAPSGDDPMNHLAYITQLKNSGLTLSINGYPMGFHIIIALLSSLFHASIIKAIIWASPLLLIIPIFSIYYCGKTIFRNSAAGAIAVAAWAFLALGPIRAFADGNYPNLLASSFLLPFAIAWAYQFIVKPKIKSLLWLLFYIGLIIATHHLTLVYLFIAIVPWAVIFIVRAFIRAKSAKKYTILLLSVVAATMAVVAAWEVIGPIATPYLNSLLQNGTLSSQFGAISQPISFFSLLELNNQILVWLGLAGLALILISRQTKEAKWLMFLWLLLMFLFSTTSFFGLPGRFVRELAIPLSLCIGFLGSRFWQWASYWHRGWVAVVIIILTISIDWTASFSRPFALPNPFGSLMRVSPDQVAALNYADEITPANGLIIANNGNPYLPYLVSKDASIMDNFIQISENLKWNNVTTIYIAPRPPLTDEKTYPFYADYNDITEQLKQVSEFVLAKKFADGTEVYQKQ